MRPTTPHHVPMGTPSRLLPFGAACMLIATLAPDAAAGGLPDVAIVAAAETTPTGPRFLDPQSKLMATGLFGAVDIIDAYGGTPTLAQLQAYDAVITWTNYSYQDSVALGDVLADYVDAGGGVVVAVFATSDLGAARSLQGRWLTGNYPVIVQQGGTTTSAATLGVVHDPAHPVMAGVTNIDGGSSSFRPTTTALTAGSTLIASWSDGKVMAAEHALLSNRIDLGLYPPSNLASTSSWITGTDGDELMANALVYVAAGGSSSTAFCSGDGTATACPCGNAGAAGRGCASSVDASGALLSSSGNPSLSADTLVLAGSAMPNSSALYFQGTAQLNGGMGAVFGDGLRCASGSIVRIKTVTNASGMSQYPQGGDPSVSVRGMVAAPGTRTYQVWYRNAAPFCTAFTFNLTNGVEVAWGS